MSIVFKNVSFSYKKEAGYVLKDINLKINKGEFVSIVGPNGSGKSTFGRLINAIYIPQKGDVFISELNTKDTSQLWNIRRKVGMVFQNPDNQIVASIVENDVAFGLENLGFPSEVIRNRVNEALSIVGLLEFRHREPHYLSGGQKQRLAIAGILAMEPEYIILDEPTSMLDPKGKREVLNLIKKLNKENKITIILITQDMEEVLLTDRSIALLDGTIEFDGDSKDLLSDFDKLNKLSLSPTKIGFLVHLLRRDGLKIPNKIFKREELVECLCR